MQSDLAQEATLVQTGISRWCDAGEGSGINWTWKLGGNQAVEAFRAGGK